MHGCLEVGREITDEIQNANRMASMDPTGEIDVEKSGCTSYCESHKHKIGAPVPTV